MNFLENLRVKLGVLLVTHNMAKTMCGFAVPIKTLYMDILKKCKPNEKCVKCV